ncbi:hypothetical protein ACFQ1E_03585 [Sphingomonas canadensis]|uniref:Uncharacterized protein n=1 Tax=Sphingomonas canadensis TaxID=1219257 RepID=A0ABW3H7Y2_9SPHN|nr:hypothetical protein [Sphingomonas canadensis]MCW3834676.1 hypothetical protein [Sphingomonas canadensis]
MRRDPCGRPGQGARQGFPLALAAALLAGCSGGGEPGAGNSAEPPRTQAPARAANVTAPGAGLACERLPLTGICASRAVDYMEFAEGKRPAAAEGCRWVPQETEMPGGDALLYLALRCGTRTAQLAYSGDIETSQLTYESSAFGDRRGEVAVVLAGAEEGDPGVAILALARSAIRDRGQAAACTVRNAGVEGWPADALVVDLRPGAVPPRSSRGSRRPCGPYGVDADSPAFWRVFQHISWFFRLGRGHPEFDPGSFTLLAQFDTAGGDWGQAQ